MAEATGLNFHFELGSGSEQLLTSILILITGERMRMFIAVPRHQKLGDEVTNQRGRQTHND